MSFITQKSHPRRGGEKGGQILISQSREEKEKRSGVILGKGIFTSKKRISVLLAHIGEKKNPCCIFKEGEGKRGWQEATKKTTLAIFEKEWEEKTHCLTGERKRRKEGPGGLVAPG